MSLADELLADLEEDGPTIASDEEVGPEDDEIDDIDDVEDVTMETADISQSVRNVAKLQGSEELSEIMQQIDYYSQQPADRKVSGAVEADPEYQLIVAANNITVEIDNELNVIHKFVRDIYYKRFPELESLINTPLEYLKTVKELGNRISTSKNSELLQQILTPATIMVVSVTASTTQGTELDESELQRTIEACDMAVELTEKKKEIFEYVESRMTYIAPNLSCIMGASTAAKVMGLAGGLTNLAKMPACNILVLGAQKKTLSGFSTVTVIPHTGYIYYGEIVQKTAPELRKKAARLVAAKTVLAARMDSFHGCCNGELGEKLRAEIEQKLDKLQEPAPVKQIKPLAAPIEAPRKKRGGRRYRKMKERLGMTDIRKQANRMNFGEIEEDAYQDSMGFSVGNLGKKSSGRVRGPPVDSKTKAKVSKSLQQKLHKQNQTFGGSTTIKKHVSGTASSVAFTPLQGLEIVNPQAAEASGTETSNKYFSSTAGFMNVQRPQNSAGAPR